MAGAFLPAEGQAEVWSGGPDAVLVGSVTPSGTAQPRPGGWLLSGRWPYLSAVAHSDWALVCGVVPGGAEGVPMLFAVPRAAYRIEDTWFSVGMQATGSNTLVLDEVFVPHSRAFDRGDLFAGRADQPPDAVPACYRPPLPAVNGLIFATPAAGAARGMTRTFAAAFADRLGSRARPLPGTAGVQGVRASAELALARSAGEVDAAWLLLERAARLVDGSAPVGPLDTARNLRDCSLVADLAVTAVNRLFREAGTRGQLTSSSMQRLWRDVTSISTHVALQFEPAARGYADQLLRADRESLVTA
jgi:two-component flavin-dependent monooxygenase/oxygenase LndZ5